MSPARPSRVQWLPGPTFLSAAVRYPRRGRSSSSAAPSISSSSPLFFDWIWPVPFTSVAIVVVEARCWWPDELEMVGWYGKATGSRDLKLDLFSSLFFLLCRHGVGGKERRWNGSNFSRSILFRSWSSLSTVHISKIWSNELMFFFKIVLLHPLVERRPLRVQTLVSAVSAYSSRSSSHKGGSFSSSTWQFLVQPPVYHRWCCSHLSAPSGFVPGGGGIGSDLKNASRTRLLFSFV